MHNHADEIQSGDRFEFGENWSRFLELLDDNRIEDATLSLKTMLDVSDLKGKNFLDIGSGSGLFSLSAKNIGAIVRSFDFDPKSVACTNELKKRFHANDDNWVIEEGSVLNDEYVKALGEYDIVYSWGVLHHTGQMWRALDNAADLVKQNGKLYIAIYNDQGFVSRYWRTVKKLYVKHKILRLPISIIQLPYPFLLSWVIQRLFTRPGDSRGMSFWYDFIDWIGGYPFEVASPEKIINYFSQKGFLLSRIKITKRNGCNEYVFKRC